MTGWMFAAAAACALSGAAHAQSIEVTGRSFYAEGAAQDGTTYHTETRRIAYEPDVSCYGWQLRFRPGRGTRALRERLVLPGPAERWGGVDDTPETTTQLSPARDVGETDLMVDLATGVATNGWCVAQGDPRGPYRIEVTDGARLLVRFDFVVGAEKGTRPGR